MEFTASPFQKLCQALGSYAAVGAVFDPPVSPQAVAKWAANGVPAERVLPLSAAVGFAATPHELRPDLYPHPEDGLPATQRSGGAISAALDEISQFLTDDENRELLGAIARGPAAAAGFLRGLEHRPELKAKLTEMAIVLNPLQQHG